MTKTKIDKNNTKAMRRTSTAAILLSAIAFISSSALTNIESISVFAAAPSNGSNNSSTSINQTSAHMLVQNLTPLIENILKMISDTHTGQTNIQDA